MATHDNKKRAVHSYSPSRRALLKGLGFTGFTLAASGGMERAVSQPVQAPARGPETACIPVREALENMTALEADVLEAMVNRILPSDENGPGAAEARASHYIDRALAAHHSDKAPVYSAGLNALNDHALTVYGIPFPELDEGTQDVILESLASGDMDGFGSGSAEFFNMVRDHTIEGTFSDPYYGGNHEYIGWDLLGYPGVRLAASEEDVAQGANLPASRQSAYDHASFTKTRGGQ